MPLCTAQHLSPWAGEWCFTSTAESQIRFPAATCSSLFFFNNVECWHEEIQGVLFPYRHRVCGYTQIQCGIHSLWLYDVDCYCICACVCRFIWIYLGYGMAMALFSVLSHFRFVVLYPSYSSSWGWCLCWDYWCSFSGHGPSVDVECVWI